MKKLILVRHVRTKDNELTKLSGHIDSKVSEEEYDDIINYALDLGVKNAYIQEGDTSDESFIPPFDLEGL